MWWFIYSLRKPKEFLKAFNLWNLKSVSLRKSSVIFQINTNFEGKEEAPRQMIYLPKAN